VRLPFHMPGVVPGDVLRLNRAANLGSRDYTMKGEPYLDDRLFVCRAVVEGTESDPMKIKEKTKRRQRKVKTVKSKHKHTVLRISELKVHTLEELEAAA
jgi:large subunit ribosomal protein L21